MMQSDSVIIVSRTNLYNTYAKKDVGNRAATKPMTTKQPPPRDGDPSMRGKRAQKEPHTLFTTLVDTCLPHVTAHAPETPPPQTSPQPEALSP